GTPWGTATPGGRQTLARRPEVRSAAGATGGQAGPGASGPAGADGVAGRGGRTATVGPTTNRGGDPADRRTRGSHTDPAEALTDARPRLGAALAADSGAEAAQEIHPSPAAGRICIVLAAVLWSTSGAFTKVLREATPLGLNVPLLDPLQIACLRVL